MSKSPFVYTRHVRLLIPSLIPGPDAVLAVLARANTANTDLSMLGFPVLAVLAELSNTGANTVTSVQPGVYDSSWGG